MSQRLFNSELPAIWVKQRRGEDRTRRLLKLSQNCRDVKMACDRNEFSE